MSEVRISPSELRKALALAASVTERRNIIPVLGMIRIDIGQDCATISATDLDILSVSTVEIAELTGEPFSFLISPRLMSDVTRFAESLITIGKADDILTINADDMEVQVRDLLHVDDWPEMQAMGKTGSAKISEAILEKAMRAAATSISTEETRYYLNGSFFHDAGDGKLTIASTDGRRLTKYETGQPWPKDHKAILPRKAHALIHGRLTKGGNKSVQIEMHRDLRLHFKGDGWEIWSKCIDGTFPDYNRVIPAPADKISFALTVSALRRFPSTGERSRAVKIDPDAGKMSVTNADGMTATMPVSGRGEAVGFNIEYLKIFAALSGTIKVSGSGASDPFRILSEDPGLTQVIMPMRV